MKKKLLELDLTICQATLARIAHGRTEIGDSPMSSGHMSRLAALVLSCTSLTKDAKEYIEDTEIKL